jgi:Tol biopolymer transport system component
LVLLLTVSPAISAPAGYDLLQKGLVQERANGNLEEAIRFYTQIVEEYADDHTLAAKALLRIGACYEKLGRSEARNAYQRVIEEYAGQVGQVEEVKVARERLVALTDETTSTKPDFRKIRIPTKLPMRGSGMLSPNGQKLAFVSGGSLWVVPVHGKSSPDIAGTPVRLTEPMHAWDASNVSINWSTDGKWIGFRVAAPQEDRNAEEELYVVRAQGGTPKRVPITWKDWAMGVLTLRYALSTDAETLYFAAGSRIEDTRIYSMPVQGGEKQPVTDPLTREPAISPDGSRLAYVKRYLADVNVPRDQICMKSLDHPGEPVVVCDVTENWLRSPIWSPDGNRIAFLAISAKGGSPRYQIWLVNVFSDAQPGSPTIFELPGETPNLLAGWTQDNKIGILIPSERQHPLFTVPAAGGKATQLTTAYTCMPVWAPGDKGIYFDGAHGAYRAGLEYVSADGGKVKRIPVRPKNFQPVFPSELAISRDGSKLLLAGFYRQGEPGPQGRLFTVPVDGGMVTPLRIDADESISRAMTPQWSPDEKRIAFIAREEVHPDLSVYNIFVMPAAGGKPQRISSRQDQVERGTLTWSPDSERIASYGKDRTLRMIPSEGGSSKVLISNVGGGIPWAGIAWSPDGEQIAYTAGGDLHVVSPDGGEPRKIETGLDARHLKVDWSPDGERIAFTAGQGGAPELWLMENFLPE